VSCLITSLIILSFGLCDRIDQVIKNSVKVILPYNRFGYCYHSVHIVRLARFQSDHIKRLPRCRDFCPTDVCPTDICPTVRPRHLSDPKTHQHLSDLRLKMQHLSDLRLKMQHLSDLRLKMQHLSDLRLKMQHLSDLRLKMQHLSDLRLKM
jgi:hypothetical protein